MDELVVRADMARQRRRFGWVVVIFGGLTGIFVIASGLIAQLDTAVLRGFVWVFLTLTLSQVLQLAIQCWFWGGRFACTRPLRLTRWGIEIQNVTGFYALPWEAVATVRRKGRCLVLTPDSRARPGERGLEADLTAWARACKRGIIIGPHALQPGFSVIIPAFAHFTGGRLSVL